MPWKHLYILLHIHILYYRPLEITCWTCHARTDNEACNNWAPNVPCSLEDAVCETVHAFVYETAGRVYDANDTPTAVSLVSYARHPVLKTTQVDKLCVERLKCRKPGCYEKDKGRIVCINYNNLINNRYKML